MEEIKKTLGEFILKILKEESIMALLYAKTHEWCDAESGSEEIAHEIVSILPDLLKIYFGI